jgi:hypothetical protein
MVWVDSQALRRQLDDVRAQRWAAIEASRVADEQRTANERLLMSERESRSMVQTELAQARAELAELGRAREADRQARRVPVFVGRQSLGEAWMVPSVAGTNRAGAGGGAVVVLDELTVRQLTAGARREAARTEASMAAVTVNHNYGSYPAWGYGWPGYWWVAGNSGTNAAPPAGGGQSPPAQRVLPDTRTGGSSGIWRPTEKPFLPSPSPWPIVTPPRATGMSPGGGVVGGNYGSGVIRPSTPMPRPTQLPTGGARAVAR